MVAICSDTAEHDPLLPWLKSIKIAFDAHTSSKSSYEDLDKLVSDCITAFKNDNRYSDDVRFLKIWFLHMDASSDFESVYSEMERYKICLSNSELYISYALFLEMKGRLTDAFKVYQLGIARKAEPLEDLNRARALFCERMSEMLEACSLEKVDAVPIGHGDGFTNPWSTSVINDLLQKMQSQISKYKGYHMTTKSYSGKVALSNLAKSARNKVVEIGGRKYMIKGCAGQGGFAQVFKAYVNSNADDVVAMKIQKPAFPWEFYMYRQLDKRVVQKNRSNFGYAHRLHLYSDYSVLVCDYLSNGTLQDAINSNVVTGGFMEEVLCIYYTIEMLSMLEGLHSAGIIHGDFKPDNLLIRYASDDLTEESFRDRSSSWSDQGLCLVDWGRGIDLSLFPGETKFKGDCRTSGFRCVEMQEDKPWTFQVDTYGLCVIVHMMLHNSYMEIEKKTSNDGSYLYKPKSALKRYWQSNLWTELFTKLLNFNPNENHNDLLKHLKETFEAYMCSNPALIKKLKQLLLKQRTSLCSA